MKLQIEYLPIEELMPYDKNARKHKKEDVGAIVKSIQEFGMNDPIGIWSEKNIIFPTRSSRNTSDRTRTAIAE